MLLVLDSTNLARHLMLAAPILALGLPTLIILNMADDLRNRGGKLDLRKLSHELGAPVALISARGGEGIDQVFDFLAGAMAKPLPTLLPVLQDVPKCREWAGSGGQQGRLSPADRTQMDAPPGFGFPASGGRSAGLPAGGGRRDPHHLHGGRADQRCRDKASSPLSGNWLADCAADLACSPRCWWMASGRAWAACVVFLPQVLLLFLFIGILEDSGYLARAALIADRTMARVGLQGKSFIPLLSAYGCAVPAIMATRTIENKRDRIATILIAPFMTCSARLPVYALLIAAFIPNRNLLGQS